MLQCSADVYKYETSYIFVYVPVLTSFTTSFANIARTTASTSKSIY